jgi:hypothetical protein
MTPEKYKALINASGGFTKDVKRGDRPQPLTKEDEAALTKAWKNLQNREKISVQEKAAKKKN